MSATSSCDEAFSLPFDTYIEAPSQQYQFPLPHPLDSGSGSNQNLYPLIQPFQRLGNQFKPSAAKSASLCKNYIRGGCYVENCKFWHPSPLELIAFGQDIAYEYTVKYGKIEVCKDYLNGKCQRDSCKYKHCDEYWRYVICKFNELGDGSGHKRVGSDYKYRICDRPSE